MSAREFLPSVIANKIHHSRERAETNSNYGNLLSIHDRIFRTFTGATVIVLGTAVALSMALAQGNGSTGTTAGTQKQPTVLFICPHGAAKSILASAYFQKAAKERGLNVRVETAGIEPQDAVSPVVTEHLERNGYTVPVTRPRAVTKEDLDQADVVISLGCDLSRLPVAPRSVQKWDDVPAPSEDLKGADEKIRRRVMALVEELAARQQK